MDRELFVENVKKLSHAREELPTISCKKAGVGASFISDINRGRTPSVEKVEKLARYFGVSTSALLGEEPIEIQKRPKKQSESNYGRILFETFDNPPGPAQPYLVAQYNRLSPADQEEVMAIINMKLERSHKDK